MSAENKKPIIGFSCGDINGIGIEIILKSLVNTDIFEQCVPVVFASSKSLNYYRRNMPESHISYNITKDITRLSQKQINIFSCWEEEVAITPGQLNETGGKYALLSLQAATEALSNNQIDALVTAPIHKKNIQSSQFNYTGHTPYFKEVFKAKDVLMLMVAQNLKVGLVTEHVSVSEVSKHLTKAAIVSKINIMNAALQQDFGVSKPKIAVLGLNPHAGDEGLIGKEEIDVIAPAITEAKNSGKLVFGPYSADGFFAHAQHEKFDAVLAMYHDQGLIPFKSLCIGEGVNYTAGLPVIRTSPDHGTAFDIAGQGKANHLSCLEALFMAIDIVKQRDNFKTYTANPLKKMSSKIIGNAKDE